MKFQSSGHPRVSLDKIGYWPQAAHDLLKRTPQSCSTPLDDPTGVIIQWAGLGLAHKFLLQKAEFSGYFNYHLVFSNSSKQPSSSSLLIKIFRLFVARVSINALLNTSGPCDPQIDPWMLRPTPNCERQSILLHMQNSPTFTLYKVALLQWFFSFLVFNENHISCVKQCQESHEIGLA